jgi:hypothetical protein
LFIDSEDERLVSLLDQFAIAEVKLTMVDYGTTSRPFPSPSGKKIAGTVINHYGDAVLQGIVTAGLAD